MPRSQMTTGKDLLAMSDAQLCEFMKKNRQRDGSFDFYVDWTVLSKEERDCLAGRLRLIQREVTDKPAANSRPLDLDKLDALLRDVASREDSQSRDRPRARESETQSPDESPQETYKRKEMEAYNNLVNDGGLPLYQIDLLESVSKDPDAYREMLTPFWRRPRSGKPSEMDTLGVRDAIQRQWHRWQNFRKWQLNNRGIDYKDANDEEVFSAHVEDMKRDYREMGWDEQAARLEADPNSLKQPGRWWHSLQKHHNWQRRYQRELGCESLSDYQGAVKARLTQHGFTRSFYLAEDPKQQDKLTTWIEYLGFEYWWLDRYTASKERLKPKHDNAWMELKNQGVVKDGETPEFIRTDASAMQNQFDEDRAWKSMKDAESEAANVLYRTQQDPNRHNIPKKQRRRMLAKARERFSNARETVDSTTRRNDLLLDFVRGTFDYNDAKQDVVDQTNLLEWAVAETRSIEDEQKAATLGRGATRKRKESAEDSCIVEPSSKKQKSCASKYGSQPSNSGIGTRDRRSLRSRDVPSADMNRQLDQEGNHCTAQAVPLTEAEAEPVTLGQRKKVAFQDDSSTPPRRRKSKSSARRHDSQTSDRVLRAQNRPTTSASQHPDQHQAQRVQDAKSSSKSPKPKVPSQEFTQGLRRSARLKALRRGA
ncbi:hypothetical protein MHUMG1_05297 [Metarhizium humberi]|uniref:Ankyrin 2,3/unc44 n=1 Tax=Metarhizium humberi TaxID=2596975 RepID=A0A9P8S847_9HYPO|nr:hypothetical protein MHUMG1_05297 [Metarhizium humberi]